MMKAFVHAYTAGNLGDDLMIRILCQRYPNVRFRICADEPYKERFSDILNLKVFSPTDKIVQAVDKAAAILKYGGRGFWKLLVKNSFATVHIGGSVFVQHQDDFDPAYRLDDELSARSKRIYVVGANFGPYTDEQYFRQYHELFKRYGGVSFRDKYSYEAFSNLTNVVYAPDVVFNYDMESAKQKRQVLISAIALKDRAGKYGISQHETSYKNFLAKLIKAYIAKGYCVKFISFCKFQCDEEAIQDIMELAGVHGLEQVSVCAYDQNLTECMESFAESEIVIGTRFHSVVLGWLAKKKVLPIVYDVKTERLLQDNQCMFYLGMDELGMDVGSVLDKIEEMPFMDINQLVKEARGQFKELDKVFKKSGHSHELSEGESYGK